jgi:hypothetical protein
LRADFVGRRVRFELAMGACSDVTGESVCACSYFLS